MDLEKNQNFNMHMHFSVNMHYRAKYYGDWSSSCRDMASHLEFVLSISHKEHLLVFVTVRNLTGINEVLSIICRFLYLASLA